MRIHLKIPDDAEPPLRARLTYAFRLFCAIYGHLPLVDPAQAENPDVTISYQNSSSSGPGSQRRTVSLSRGYRVRSLREPAPAPVKYASDGVSTLLHHTPAPGQAPDWLGEIFEWVSCADEYSVDQLDRVGRTLFAATYSGRHDIDTRVPYAAVAMLCLQQEICRIVPRFPREPRALEGAPSHLVVTTHDVDYFPLGRPHAVSRLLRNAVISCVVANQPWLGMRQAAMAVRMALGGTTDPLDQIVTLAKEELQQGIRASYNFLVRHAHRRDALYTLEHPGVEDAMHWLELQGMEVGAHGSYTCLDHPRGVEEEIATLIARGFHPQGGRQHWLRYTLDRLIPAVERAGLSYDMSVGWADRIGFRAGACFAFPPYDFANECPASFLEIPMVIMDQALLPRRDRRDGPRRLEQMLEQATALLETSRRFGWGGISLLWHPAAFGSGWLPREVGNMFWTLADGRAARDEAWITGSDFLEKARQRFVDAGLALAKPSPAIRNHSNQLSEFGGGGVRDDMLLENQTHSHKQFVA